MPHEVFTKYVTSPLLVYFDLKGKNSNGPMTNIYIAVISPTANGYWAKHSDQSPSDDTPIAVR